MDLDVRTLQFQVLELLKSKEGWLSVREVVGQLNTDIFETSRALMILARKKLIRKRKARRERKPRYHILQYSFKKEVKEITETTSTQINSDNAINLSGS